MVSVTRYSIIEKLRQALQADVSTEAQVVYLLAEIRKVLEQIPQDNYRTLRFYCSFVLHTKMTRAAAKRILSLFDRAYPLLSRNEDLPIELQRQIDETAALRTFKNQMREFLAAHGLPEQILHGDRWARFIHTYGQIVNDCELVIDGANDLQIVDRVVVHLDTADQPLQGIAGTHTLFRIRWSCYAKDGTSGDYSALFTFADENTAF